MSDRKQRDEGEREDWQGVRWMQDMRDTLATSIVAWHGYYMAGRDRPAFRMEYWIYSYHSISLKIIGRYRPIQGLCKHVQ